MTRTVRAEGLASRIEAELRRHADPARAEGEKRYLKSDLEFIGVPTPVFRRVLKDQLKAAPPLNRPALLALVSELWALVDNLAAHVAGVLVERFPELASTLDRWARDSDFWVRRAAMLALLLPLRRGAGDFERFGRYADAMLEEKEFFIRKAIGWVLREVSKKRPALVAEWLAPRMHRASGVTLREALKYLPPESRSGLLSASRSR